ncbi:hypothetical protein SNOG_09153 [Parastagonospora nodorum SN15]|uniref:Uncharacterized protein n=1 Tax=Phaeosphaeria nodorum (strain SN15 / ATCC MYA-4574 / FGSC 10173) TaxID=321614 RepID=Q0UGG1_PHANO|nr:hypothetical protein SNOG_09153 [Parastagonospora nodorum SN15]EAT83345.1 hypothetical protein SNOG_09153 [Parastagonospora nodorum SN15]
MSLLSLLLSPLLSTGLTPLPLTFSPSLFRRVWVLIECGTEVLA